MTLTILLPVYNDWDSAALVCAALDQALVKRPAVAASVLLVDDGSTVPPSPGALARPAVSLKSVAVLTLRRNLGHQRAIAVGLAYLHRERSCDAVVVMDADGEDRPEDVVRLLDAFADQANRTIIFAERRRRFASVPFRLAYWLYRVVHRGLTGLGVKIGNFSILPSAALPNLVVQSSLWSHYAATVVNSRLPMKTVPLDRGRRLTGTSRMNFVALAAHGLSAVSVFRETVATRVLLAASGVAALGGVALVALVLARVAWGWTLPPWASLGVGLLALGTLQVIVAALALTLVTLASREQFNVLPVRDYHYFVLDCREAMGR